MANNVKPTALTIRPICESDAGYVVQMIQRLAEQHHEVSQAQPADILKHALGPEKISHIWIAECGKEMAGFIEASYGFNYPERIFKLHVNLIYVREDYRQQGMALALIQEALKNALNAGCNSFWIEAYSTNVEANRFYQRLGLHERPSTFISLSKYVADHNTMKRIVAIERNEN